MEVEVTETQAVTQAGDTRDLSAEDRLREMLDRQDITALVVAYARYMDLNDPDGVASLFADDAVIDYGRGFPARVVGPEALASTLRETLAHVAATAHHCSNIDIVFDSPNEARGVVYLYAWHRFPDGRPDFHLWAQYHDRYKRVPGVGWRISYRTIKVSGAEGVEREFDMIGRNPGRAPERPQAR
jgi:hypothetical protein